MPNIKSAKKRVRLAKSRTLASRRQKSESRTAVKKALAAIESGAADARELVLQAQSLLDRTAAKGRLSKNTAARKKSQLARKLNQA